MDAIWKGILAGLAYGLMLGPLFFAGLRVTLLLGLRHGFALVAGAFLSDLMLAAGSWWSISRIASLVQSQFFQSFFGVGSALLLFGFGLSAFIPKRKKAVEQEDAATEVFMSRRRVSLVQGFLLNIVNPSNWLFWVGLATAASANALAGGNKEDSALFLASALGVLVMTDLAKVLLANRLGRKLKPHWVQNVVRFAGLVLMVVGAGVLIKLVS